MTDEVAPSSDDPAADRSTANYERLTAGNDDSARVARALLAEAVARDASDIHISVSTVTAADGHNPAVVDVRVSGHLERYDSYSSVVGEALVRRFQNITGMPLSVPGASEGTCEITVPSDDGSRGCRLWLASGALAPSPRVKCWWSGC